MATPLSTLIIDDEAPARLLVRQYLADFPAFAVVGECADGLSALAAIREQAPDVLFLDIQMPGLTGFDVLARLDQVPAVVFFTAYDQYALGAFDAGAVDYLLKPYDRLRFGQAAARLLARATAPTPDAGLQRLLHYLTLPPAATEPARTYPARLFVPHGARLVAVPVASIRWAKAAGDYCTLHTSTGSCLSNLGITAFQERLDPSLFLRVHRSALVALNVVLTLERDGSSGYYATLEGGHTMRVSRLYAEALRPLLG